MKIKELNMGGRNINVEGTIIKKEEPRQVNLRAGGTAMVADCVLEDDTGTITLSLWDNDIETVQEGDIIKIENGYITTFRDEKRLNVGRYGKLSVVNKGSS
ncbi:MAG: DNA-binding protein [Nitrososphaerota archaeon]|jgi:replication factor A1|nr:DNA-binding protein [Nitrososphaerota archaeon]MDG7039103.1 DNA-binding protein [Nitrososphaerota archaeon]MDG7041092.1 DNA-binding protein [Nitrososphaerota archaeon]MDG7042980.1 DNA-binding protein [Nitrososphaerota archaeon]MDG7043982.1 DNA-binding protein [Nitrososphaerota archaeon]